MIIAHSPNHSIEHVLNRHYRRNQGLPWRKTLCVSEGARLSACGVVLVLLTGLFTGSASERFSRKKTAFVQFNSMMGGYLQDRGAMSHLEGKLLMPFHKKRPEP